MAFARARSDLERSGNSEVALMRHCSHSGESAGSEIVFVRARSGGARGSEVTFVPARSHFGGFGIPR